ncbi:hypothetical protein [Agromyces ramosus]|uniref:Uncharacterized protein n=1 Tax=Agromyces ramosus TaxID=33879 RepID=A0ABU0R7X6_9MICO|nr:hypothetical protein [Agromyces ramosus]MDQ0893842.1 hypothetical protein [Agromyces ramosus]
MTRIRTIVPATMLAVSLALGLSACASSGAQLSADLHASVVQISERAATGDYAGALAELALLDRDVTSASDDGRLDSESERAIREAMELVRSDLEAAEIATTPTPEPEPAPEEGGDDEGNDGDKGNDDKGKGDKGKGEGKGNDG